MIELASIAVSGTPLEPGDLVEVVSAEREPLPTFFCPEGGLMVFIRTALADPCYYVLMDCFGNLHTLPPWRLVNVIARVRDAHG